MTQVWGSRNQGIGENYEKQIYHVRGVRGLRQEHAVKAPGRVLKA